MILKIIPNRALLAGLWLCLLLGLWAAFDPAILPVWQGLAVVLALSAALDVWLSRRRGLSLNLSRQAGKAWPLGQAQTVWLIVDSPRHALRGWLHDQHPDDFECEGLPAAFNLAAGQWVKIPYQITPLARGIHHFGQTELRLVSPLGLWVSRHLIGVPQTLRVYPDFARVAQYALFATDHRLSQLGVMRQRRRGEGMDFHQLRDYRREDSPRQIDWKATAKMKRPISRDYQDERDQQILFMLDCGQRMRSRDDDLSHFDHTLNAMLLLTYVALRQGDAVGLSTFAHEAPRYFAPRKSLDTVQRLLNTTFDLQPSLRTPDYLMAGEHLAIRLRKRSLVVILTNLRDEDDDTLLPALTLLRKRHLVLLVSLREPGLNTLLEQPVKHFDDALSHAAAQEYSQSRAMQLRKLRALGIQVIDVLPRQLPTALVNRYWEMKSAGVF